MTCIHSSLDTDVQISTVLRQDGSLVVHVLDLSIKCQDCGMPFAFICTDEERVVRVVKGSEDMRKGPWVTSDRSVLGVAIMPLDYETSAATRPAEGTA